MGDLSLKGIARKYGRYLFSWEKVPGDESGRLLEFLKQESYISRSETAKIEKIDNDTKIRVTTEKNILTFEFYDERTKLYLKIDDFRGAEYISGFIAKSENGKLNIYYGSIIGGFSVIKDIFGVSTIEGNISLRSRLESVAREEHSFDVSECIFFWRAAFEQIWTHIRIRIQLNPDAGILATTMNTLRTTWENGIRNTWSNKWGCARQGELTCRLTFEVQWVSSNQHHAVRVRQGPERSNMTTWCTTDTSEVASHEFGHMLGLADEYYENPPCPNRNPVDEGTVMGKNSNIPSRMMKRFADNIGSNVVNI